MVTFGLRRRATRPESRVKGVYCSPSRRTGITSAPVRSATRPGPS